MIEGEWVIDPLTQVELPVPTYASPESTVQRAALERAGGLRVIRFFPEWTQEWPLWEDETGPSDPDALGLSSELRGQLRSWNDYWVSHFDQSRGWPNAQAFEDWAGEGDSIAQQLQREVWHFADIHAEHRMYSKASTRLNNE